MKKFFLTVALALLLTMNASASSWASGDLTIFTFAEYIDPALLKEFEEKHDVKVKLDYYESNEEMISKLQSGGLGQYDIIVPSTYSLPALRELNLVEKLDHKLLPNLKNLEETFTKMEVDPGNNWSIPYQWGTTGLLVKDFPQGQEASWAILFDPKMATEPFTMINAARDSIAAALFYLGYSINTTDPAELKKAMELMVAAKNTPQFVGYESGLGGVNKVLSGTAKVVQAYSGEGSRAANEDATLSFILPKEGFEIWTDLMAIPAKAPNLANAHAFLNFMMEPKVSAQQAVYNFAASPNAAAKEFIPSDVLNSYPSLENAKMEYIKDLGPNNRLYDEAWTAIKTQ